MPKSNTLISSSASTRMFRGFRSPWSSGPRVSAVERDLEAMAASRNSHSWIAMRAARSGGNAPAPMTSERFWPSRYSIAMKKYLPWVPYSKTVGTYRLHLAERFLQLRSQALRLDDLAPVAVVLDRDEFQRDLAVGSRVSVARNTAAIPPLPIWWRISYAPTRWKTVVIIDRNGHRRRGRSGRTPGRPIHEPVVAGQRGARIARAARTCPGSSRERQLPECRTALLVDRSTEVPRAFADSHFA